MIKQILTSALVVLSLSLMGQNETKHQLSIELDPAPFILGGYSVSLKYSPDKTPKIAYMASIYQSDFPDEMLTKANKDKGWKDMKIKTSYATFAEFYLNKERKGFYFGPSVFWYNKSVELETTNSRTEFSTIYPNIRAGYVWYPLRNIDLYVNPWINIGSEINVDSKNEINGIEFESNKLNYILALHIGYSFNFKTNKASR
ncbi:hypothetical protein [Polaribacter dokdonensis]|uniref:DUF3575 domain-containing protein n=1 Tax=Polaribacter dokdonensis DSW-5 TaxID=1300348 RepID=A0A0N0CGC9_9FLAO|nr:hypothetical protein [Polaribacter dokdonensis]KOY53120.1 hypothetical protein I602_2680 [Polaribacter dokdonensis DSW-5]SEE57389.1 hypothetical protein SAMN05444353_2455 [Polaribacter dokdonensis DSW-5]